MVAQARANTSGAAALLAVLFYWQKFDGREDVLVYDPKTDTSDERKLHAGPEGIALAEVARVAKQFRLGASLVRVPMADALPLSARENAIVSLAAAVRPNRTASAKQVVVLVGRDERYVYVMDPSARAGYGYLPKDEFARRFAGDAVIISGGPDDRPLVSFPGPLTYLDGDSSDPPTTAALLPLPIFRQSTDFSCGPTSLLSVLRYWRAPFDGLETDLYPIVAADPNEGTAPEHLAAAARKEFHLSASVVHGLAWEDELTVEIARDPGLASRVDSLAKNLLAEAIARTPDSADEYRRYGRRIEAFQQIVLSSAPAQFAALKARLATQDATDLAALRRDLGAGKTVILDIEAWQDVDSDWSKLIPWQTDWDDGHYVVLAGMTDQAVFVMDPSSDAGYGYIPLPEFLTRWHDTDTQKGKDRHGHRHRPRNRPVDKHVEHLRIVISGSAGQALQSVPGPLELLHAGQ
jgi:predicted double-glycine peptidase